MHNLRQWLRTPVVPADNQWSHELTWGAVALTWLACMAIILLAATT